MGKNTIIKPSDLSESQERQNFEDKIAAVAVELNEVPEIIYKIGEFQEEATITKIQDVPAVDVFGEKCAKNQKGKNVYRVHYSINIPTVNEVPKEIGLTGTEIISKTTGRSPNSKLYKFRNRYSNLKLKTIVKVENDEFGYWHIIL